MAVGGRTASRLEQRRVAVSDLRQKLHRSAVAMSFLPASKLALHLGLGHKRVAERLLGDSRLTQRIYWQLVDDNHAPDIAAIPAHSGLKIIDSVADFEDACECVDIALALNEYGIMLGKDQIKELARRFGDAKVKWAWDNRDIWAESAPSAAGRAGAVSQPAMVLGATRKADARRMLLEYLAISLPDVAEWMGRKAISQQRKASMTPQMQIVQRVVERLLNPSRMQRHG
jgi:hypothetical protein